MTNRRWVVVLVAAIAVLTAFLLAAGGSTLAQDGPTGTLALERVAADLGFDVDRGDFPPRSGAFVLVDDLRDGQQVDELLGWVATGNRLVVADTNSLVLERLAMAPAGRVTRGLTGVATLRPDCDLAEVAGVTGIEVRVGERRLAPPTAGTFSSCLVRDGLAYLVVAAVGNGEVVVLGGSSALRNELLEQADNASFALRLFGDTDRVRLGSAAPAAPAGGFWATLPDAARALLLAALVGTVVVVLGAWRRLGEPLPERSHVTVDASTILPSVAGLFRASGDRGHVAGRLQAHLADLVRRRNGIPADAPDTDVAAVIADLTGTSRAAAHTLLTTVPADEEALVRLARDIHSTLDALEAR